jgi:DNA-binding MarR family transcriptional regulator
VYRVAPDIESGLGEDVGTTADTADTIGAIETELLNLVRHLETLGRRSSLYRTVDRAGYLLLRTLDRTGPLPAGQLANQLQLDASTVTRQAGALVSAGFVERRSNPDDGRSSDLAVTAAGRRTMREVERQRRTVLRGMFEAWDDTERVALRRSLVLLNHALVRQVGDQGRARTTG